MFDGKNSNSFYITDFIDEESMLRAFFSSIIIPYYNGFNFYFHNGSKFDIIFILKTLLKMLKLNQLIKMGKF